MDGRIAGVIDVVEAFVGSDGVDGLSEVIGGLFGGPLLSLAHPVLGLCEGPFDGVEIGRVGQSLAPALRTGLPLWLPRLSRITMSPGLRVGTRNCWTQARKRAVEDEGARPSTARKVRVRQWPLEATAFVSPAAQWGSGSQLQWPPTLSGPPVSRQSATHLGTEDTLTRAATGRIVSPARWARTTRLRRSWEQGQVIPAGLFHQVPVRITFPEQSESKRDSV